MAADGQVVGHYILKDQQWQPVLSESSELFKAVVGDAISQFEELFEKDVRTRLNSFFTLLYWGSNTEPRADTTPKEASTSTAVSVKNRTLVMLAAFHGSLRVLSYLLSKGADPSIQSPDGLTANDFAASGGSPNAATIAAMLKDAEGNFTLPNGQLDPVVAPPSHRMSFTEVATSERVSHSSIASFSLPLDVSLRREGDQDLFTSTTNTSADQATYSTAELTRSEYATDTFRMFCFKVLRCSKRYAHDWRACPFAHPTENARRRDPREFQYCTLVCPDYKQTGCCVRGDACPYSHGVFEAWLHPSKYRTQLCKDGSACSRPVCFFAHGMAELRQPTLNFVPSQVTADQAVQQQAALVTAQAPSCVYVPPAGAPAIVPGVQALPPLAGSAPRSASASQQDLFAACYTAAPVAQDAAAAAAQAQLLPDVGGPGAAQDIPNAPKPRPSDSSVVSQDVGPSDQAPTNFAAAVAATAMASSTGVPVVSGAPGVAAAVSAGALPVVGMMPPPGAVPHAPVPRMSNAFARKLGLDPRDDPMVNQQKIAYHKQMGMFNAGSPREGWRGKGRKGGPPGHFRHTGQQQRHYMQPQQPFNQLPPHGHLSQPPQLPPFMSQQQAQHFLPPQQQQFVGQFQQHQQHQHLVHGQMPPPYHGAYQPYQQPSGAHSDPSTLAVLTQQFAQMSFAGGGPGGQYMLPPYMPINPSGQ